MTTDPLVRRVLIVGGGTAGWMTAAALSKLIGRHLNITLVESDAIGTIGVGEATIPTFIALHQLLKYLRRNSCLAFKGRLNSAYHLSAGKTLRRTTSTPSGQRASVLGSRFSSLLESRWNDKVSLRITAGTRLTLVAAESHKFGHIKEAPLNYAYHLDATAYAKFLRTFAESRGKAR